MTSASAVFPNTIKIVNYYRDHTCFFLTLDFSKQNGVGCVLSNVITLSERHNRTQRFREQTHQRNDQSGPQCFTYITSCKQRKAHFKYFQVQTHVQTARGSPDLNMDFRSFDNGTNRHLCKNIQLLTTEALDMM